LKNGRLRFVDLEMNLLRAAIWPVNFYTSFLFEGSAIDMIAFVLSGLALIPSELTMYPSIFPLLTPNTHFLDSV